MDSKEDVRSLFRDLFTHTEYKMFAKRLEIARRLIEGQGYDQIIRELNVTERTIANINNILADKGEGLRKVHNRLSEIERKYRQKDAERIKRLSRALNPKLSGQDVLPRLVVESVKYAGRKIKQYNKRKSAIKEL